MREINKIIIHCSDSTWGCAEVIDEWHKAKGWDGIGYHFVVNNGFPHSGKIDPDRRLEEWDGALESGRSLQTIGAHCKGHNSDSIGICLIGKGGFFTPLQLQTLRRLVHGLGRIYDLGLLAGAVVGHRDLDSGKTCPDFDVDGWL